jgi:hypothetical protein
MALSSRPGTLVVPSSGRPVGVAGRSPAQAVPSSFQAAVVHRCIYANQVGDARDAQSFFDATR